MLRNFRTALLVLAVISAVFLDVVESSVIRRMNSARVLRAVEKTQLSDGTKFERYVESGEDLPPLPIEGEDEEADGLNDPRIGHLDDQGDIAIPVDENGNVLKGFEYLLAPIVIDLDDEDEEKEGNPKAASDSAVRPNSQNPEPIRPKSELLPSQEETGGEEYDDVQNEPQEPLPRVPDLPKLDYTDSGESDEDLKAEGVDEEEQEDLSKRPGTGEVIIPSSLIEQPIRKDEVEEKSGSDGSEGSERSEGSEASERSEGSEVSEGSDRSKESVVSVKETDTIDESKKIEAEEDSDESWTDEQVENLAKQLGEDVRDKVLNGLKSWNEAEESENEPATNEDPNSILAEEQPDSDDQDGVILPDQGLTAEEIAQIAEESRKRVEPPAVPKAPIVHQGGVGGRVAPDSASHPSIPLIFLISSILFLFFR